MTTLGVTGKLVLAFVTLLLGAVLISSIATNALAVTDKDVAVAESYDYTAKIDAGLVNTSKANETVTYAPTGWKTTDCALTSVSLTNGSGTATFVLDTDYQLVASTGTIAMLNTDATNESNNLGNTTLVTYTYCPDDYMNLGWGRTLLNLVSGFFALAILAVSIGLFFSVGKDTGII